MPGIVPVQNFKQAANFAARAGATVPAWLAERFEGLDDDIETRRLDRRGGRGRAGVDLVDRGVSDFHFYTMNRADLVYAICHLLGLRDRARKRAQNCMAAARGIAGQCSRRGTRRTMDLTADHRPGRNGADVQRRSAKPPRERILVLDGAMGTQIQALGFSEEDFRGERFRDCGRDLRATTTC